MRPIPNNAEKRTVIRHVAPKMDRSVKPTATTDVNTTRLSESASHEISSQCLGATVRTNVTASKAASPPTAAQALFIQGEWTTPARTMSAITGTISASGS